MKKLEEQLKDRVIKAGLVMLLLERRNIEDESKVRYTDCLAKRLIKGITSNEQQQNEYLNLYDTLVFQQEGKYKKME